MIKRRLLLIALVALALALATLGAYAAVTDPIVYSIELDPDKLSAPGTINVTITISNSGSEDMKDPIVLYDPSAKIVEDFGTNGSAVLKAGESKTWTGTCDVSQRMLDSGAVVYYAKYNLYNESGEAVPQSPAIRGVISAQAAEVDLDVRRTISPSAAPEGQTVIVKYELQNSGTVALKDITIQENKDVYAKKQKIPELKPGQRAEIKFPVKMGKKDLTSGAKITYKSDKSSKAKTYTVENVKIINGESQLEAVLKSSSKGVPAGEKIKLTLTVKNKGSMAVSDLRVTDPTLGELFVGQEVAEGKTLTLEKEVTLVGDASYTFTIDAVDTSGNPVSAVTESVSVTAVDPNEVLTLDLTATPDKNEVYESPGLVRFSLVVSNTSSVDASDVVIKHGDTEIYTFEKIPAGESRRVTRDTALSMAGKYRFSAVAKDPLDNALSFESNDIQIVFSVPTPPPATSTPEPNPTPVPTFNPVTMPPISHASIGSAPKAVQSVLLPALIAAGVLLLASGALLIIATKRRADQRKAEEAALDHLERAKRRDYASPAEEKKSEEIEAGDETFTAAGEDSLPDFDLPSIDDVEAAKRENDIEGFGRDFYDEDMSGGLDSFANPEQNGSDAYNYESDGYTEGLNDDYSGGSEYYGGYADSADYADYSGGDDGTAYSGNAGYGGYAEDEIDGHVPDDRTDGYAGMASYDSTVVPRPRGRRSRSERDNTSAEV